jgi:hypothetical protein
MYFFPKAASPFSQVFDVVLDASRGETHARFLRALVTAAYQLENPFSDDSLTEAQAEDYVVMGIDVEIVDEVNGRFCPTDVATFRIEQDDAGERVTFFVRRYDRDVSTLLVRTAQVVEEWNRREQFARAFRLGTYPSVAKTACVQH